MMKKTKTMMVSMVVLFFVPVMAIGATIYPSDGDSWTEDSTSGWSGSAFGLSATEAQVGDNALFSGVLGSWPSITYTLSEAVDVSNPDASITFWLRVDCNDASWNPQIRLGSGDVVYNNLSYNFATISSTFAWQELTVNLADMTEYGTTFDSSNVSQIMFMGNNAAGTGVAARFYVDGLYLTVPEPATVALLGFGCIAGIFRKKK